MIERTDEYVINRDSAGSTVKVLASGASTIPAWLHSPVQDAASWEDVRQRLNPATPGRLEAVLWLLDLPGADEWPLFVYTTGLFGTHRMLLGFNALVLAYHRQPELLHDMARHWVSFWKGVICRIAERRVPDGVYLWEDMCYRNGPMISTRAFETFMSPYYEELVGFLKEELGVKVICVDTYGDCTLLVPLFVKAGVNMLLPWEV